LDLTSIHKLLILRFQLLAFLLKFDHVLELASHRALFFAMLFLELN
jgi:hypothetical protein